MTIKRPHPSAGTSPSISAPAAAPAKAAPPKARAALQSAANSDKVPFGLSFKQSIETVAMERAREAVARGTATPAQVGMVTAMGGAKFAGPTVSRIREAAESAQNVVEKNPKVTVWTKENRVRSSDQTMVVDLPREVVLTPEGVKVMLVHVSGEKPIATVQGHAPFAERPNVPSDAFVQSQTAHTLATFLGKLESMKLDLASVYKDRSNFNGVIRVFVNAMDILNAAYVPGKNIYFFGNHKGTFPLAADKDTVVHEASHGLLEHLVPGLVRGDGEGGAWHEAFGDLMACLYHRNPGLGEDLGTFLVEQGKAPEEMRGGIRRVDNRQALDPEVTEVHDRGLVYSGLMWSTAGKLAQMLGNEEQAADIMLGAIVKANFYITTQNPTSSDIVRALAEGMRVHLAKHAPQAAAPLIKAMLEEAKTRHMLDVALTPALEGKAQAANGEDIVKLLGQVPQIAERKDIAFEILSDRVFDNVRKVTVRPVLTNAAGTLKLPVDDAAVTAVIEDGQVFAMDASTLKIPPKFNLENGLPELAKGVEAAKEIIHSQLLAAAMQGSEGAMRILEAFDTLFSEANLQAEWVVSHGSICVVLSTLAGDFVVDVEAAKVYPRAALTFEDGHRHITAAG